MEGGRKERGGGRGRKEESIGERGEEREEGRKGKREEGRKREKEKKGGREGRKGGREGGEMDKVHVGEGITCGSEHSNLQNVPS